MKYFFRFHFPICFGSVLVGQPRDGQSCIMSQIWQIYLCKNIKRLGCGCGNTKQVVFWAHFNNYSGIFLQNSLQDAIFGMFALKFASYAHLILKMSKTSCNLRAFSWGKFSWTEMICVKNWHFATLVSWWSKKKTQQEQIKCSFSTELHAWRTTL